jgi:ABC-type branched-subunit amino acid transport system permease subunit
MKLAQRLELSSLLVHFRKRKFYLSTAIAIVALGLAAPFVSNQYIIDGVLDYFLLYVILAESYDILGGFMGYVDLGITVFFGLGAYLFAIPHYVLHWNLASAFALSTFLTASIGLLVSFPMFRLKGFYFAVATLALVPLAYQIITNPSLDTWTNGIAGIGGVTGNYMISYYAILIFALFVVILVLLISRSNFGLALTSIREDEQIAESSGINTWLVKRIAMVVSATLCGFAGCLFAWSQGSVVATNIFSFTLAFIPVTFALFGGTGTIVGPILGSGVYSLIDYVIRSPQVATSALGWTSNYENAIIGGFLIIVGVFAPGGLMSLRKPIRNFFFGVQSASGSESGEKKSESQVTDPNTLS